MAASMPSASNTYIPSAEATGNMIVDFSRNPNKFSLNRYARIMKVDRDQGRYIEMTVEEAGRILDSGAANFLWADGDDAPDGRGQVEAFEFKSYFTKRRAFPFRLGDKAVKQASWQILAQHSRIKAQQAMTVRSQLAITQLTTGGNWAAAHTSAVSSITGVTGKHDVSTTARKDIKRSLEHAADVIRKATLGAVEPGQLIFVCSPGYARKVSVSQEIVDHIKGSTDALREIEGKLGPNSQYGLPSKLYGYTVVVEDAVKVTSRKGATKAASYVLGDTTPFMVARQGSLNGEENASEVPTFDTFTIFAYEEMTVEEKYDKDNRVHKGRVVDDIDPVITAPASGFLFTAAVD